MCETGCWAAAGANANITIDERTRAFIGCAILAPSRVAANRRLSSEIRLADFEAPFSYSDINLVASSKHWLSTEGNNNCSSQMASAPRVATTTTRVSFLRLEETFGLRFPPVRVTVGFRSAGVIDLAREGEGELNPFTHKRDTQGRL